MKLTKNIKVNIYEVLADYKVKIENFPFIAILKFAEENGGSIDSDLLCEELLYPLSKRACENLLDRLSDMGYFEKDDNYDSFGSPGYSLSIPVHIGKTYMLTDLGYNSAQKKEFYEDRRGILRLYVTNNDLVSQKIIKLEELKEDSYKDENREISNLNKELKSLQNNKKIIHLKTGSFILNKFDTKCRVLESEEKQLLVNTNNKISVLTVLDFEKHINKSTTQIKSDILFNYAPEKYDYKKEILFVGFSKDDLSLTRDIYVDEPNFNNTIFNPITIENVRVCPETISDAQKWHKSLVIDQINKYFFTNKEFISFANEVADKFEKYKDDLKDSINKQDLIKQLSDPKNFYKKAKLETIDYLNY